MAVPTPPRWTPDTWRSCPIRQVPVYPDEAKLGAMEKRIGRYPPLVFAGEARRLKAQLARAAEGKAFVLQGGDCAESLAISPPTSSATRSGYCCRCRLC